MNTIDAIEETIIDEFSFLEDWMDKYQLLIDLGQALPEMDERLKIPQNLIEGCQSRVWIHAEKADDRIRFVADSDALIVKGIIALLLRVVDNQPAEAIATYHFQFIEAIGLKEHLSPTRSNGLLSMVKQIRLYALVFGLK